MGMLADAIAAELYKFLRQRSTLFWGFCAVPLGVLAWNIGLDTYLKLHDGGGVNSLSVFARMALSVDLGRQVIAGLERGDGAFFKIFFAVGAAGIFGNEYRWETWRLLTPRNSRFNLLVAKFITYGLGCAASLTGLALAAVLSAFYAAALNGAPLGLAPGFLPAALGMFAISWTGLMVLGLFVALVAVASRATTGALLAGIVFCFAQAVILSMLSPFDAPLRDFILVPELPAEALRALLGGQPIAPGVFPDPGKLLPAVLVLLGWMAFLAAAALIRFQRQDLPRE
jgi:ABC-2 type transport system permease protein